MKADVSVIEERMEELKDNPEHSNSPLRKKDIKSVMNSYKHFVNKSNIGPKVEVDTTIDAPEETLNKVVELIKPHLSEEDLNNQ